jgi:hypothetical protein
MNAVLGEKGLAVVSIRPVDQDYWVVVPSREADPTAWALLHAGGTDDDRATAALAFLDRLREVQGVEPCAELRQWATWRRRWLARARVDQAVASAQDFAFNNLPPEDAARLQELAKQINAGQEEILQSARRTLEHMKRTGELLLAAKKLVRHENFEQWVKANVAFSYRTARDYMRIAAHWEEIDAEGKRQNSAILSIQGALALLRSARGEEDGPEDDPPDPQERVPQLLDATVATSGDEGVAAQATALRTAFDCASGEEEEQLRETARLEEEVRDGQERRREEEWAQRLAERERTFNADDAADALRVALAELHARWPAGHRRRFYDTARAMLETLEAGDGAG